MADVLDVKLPEGSEPHLRTMIERLTREFGVTLIGNRLTLRWGLTDDHLASAHFVLLEVTGQKDKEREAREREMRPRIEALRKKAARSSVAKSALDEKDAVDFYVEYGDWPK